MRTAPAVQSASLRPARPLLVAGFVISFMLIGGGIDTVSVFLNAIAVATDWSRSGLSIAVSVGALSAALSTPIVGAAVDRYGIRTPMMVGVALLAIGFGILVAMREAWHFAAANVFLGPGFAACAMLPLTVAVTVTVPERTALALGIVGAGSSAGALVLAPLVQLLIDALGWRHAYVVMGTAVVLTPLPFLGFALPRGRLRKAANPGSRPHGPPVARELRRPGVTALAAVMILPALAGFSIAVHLVPYLTGLGQPGSAAAATLGVTIGVSAIGKVAGGFVGDRLGTLRTLRIALLIDVLGLTALALAESPAALAAFIVLHGLALGTHIAVVPPIAVGVLGTDRFATLFGVLQLAAMLASALGPVISGIIFDLRGDYTAAILLWVAATASAAAISYALHAQPAARTAPG
jgi:predicted MFS family arabinose efflux permease